VTLEVQYQCDRRDLWCAYWRAWVRPAGLWRSHAALALAFALAYCATQRSPCPALPASVEFLCVAVGVMLSVVVLRTLWPQLRFRRIARRITISPRGWRTHVGTAGMERRWQDVQSVMELHDYMMIVSTHGGAMVIPQRAFATAREWRQFVQAAKRWHGEEQQGA
jgi:hypothetical protein